MLQEIVSIQPMSTSHMLIDAASGGSSTSDDKIHFVAGNWKLLRTVALRELRRLAPARRAHEQLVCKIQHQALRALERSMLICNAAPATGPPCPSPLLSNPAQRIVDLMRSALTAGGTAEFGE